MSLTRDQILSADDLPRERVAVPAWAPAGTDPQDAYVWVRTLRGDERDQFESWWVDPHRSGITGVRARLAALTVVDDAGHSLFTEADIEALGQKSAAVLSTIYNVASRLNALSKQDVSELEKNSVPTAADSSSSVSPVT